MSLKSCLMISVGTALMFAATPSFPLSSLPSSNPLASGMADSCADATAAAQASGHATDADLAKCTFAAKLATYDGARAVSLNNRSVLHYVRAEYGDALNDSTAALRLDD